MSEEAVRDGHLVSLVYVSSSVQRLSSEEIVKILGSSRENNQRLGVTGMLLYKDGNFMQVLEGPEPVIRKIMLSIERDSRHRGVIVLSKTAIQERQFGDWSMAFANLDDLRPEDIEGSSSFLSESLLDQEFRTKPNLSYRLLFHFKQNLR